ncbi:MAG: hypothetical protein M1834_006960 [Cirrosporium novae-zelandiae]|nr:MAG: hypothetical protein M1834_006960 [Cirrosporium novae-zelandiae]
MPVPIFTEILSKGFGIIPYFYTVLKTIPWIIGVWFLKIYFGGAKNRSERLMHGKVIMITGGTSGIGAAIVQNLAARGGQIVLLTHYSPSDPFLVDYIDDLRSTTGNEMIYAEKVDLSSLHEIRLFATKWVDNAPPRRLDMLILCANTMTPAYGKRHLTGDGLNEEWQVNYLANYHLLSILSPALRAQPGDRDVRVIFATCSSYIGATLNLQSTTKMLKGSRAFGRSKLALMIFAQAFQKHLDAYKRPDGFPNNSRVFVIDPGLTRTPGMRRWLTGGTLFGLFIYIITYPFWWLVLKSPEQGAQSFLKSAMEAEYGRNAGGRMIKECRDYEYLRREVKDEKVQKQLWKFSEQQVEQLEKADAVKRALEKKEKEEAEKRKNKSSEGQGQQKKKEGSRRSKKAS